MSFLTNKILKLLNKALILFLFFSHTSYADISKLKVDGTLWYFSTLVDDLGTNYDNARPGPALELNFNYSMNENFSIQNFNAIINYDDTTASRSNLEFNQKLGILYKQQGTLIYPYGKIVHHDKSNPNQIDSSAFGIAVQQFFNKDTYVILDYREDTTNGSLLAGVRYQQSVSEIAFWKKNLFQFMDKPIDLKLGYADSPNLRSVKTIRFDANLTDQTFLSLRYIDNDGNGPIGRNSVAQNRKFLTAAIAYKF